MHKIVKRDKISRKEAHNLILDMARYTNWYVRFNNKPDAEVKRFFKEYGMEFEKVVEETRTFTNTITLLENLISDTSNFNVSGGIVTLIDPVTEDESNPLHSPGVYSTSAYIGLFSNSYSLFNKSILDCNYHLFLSSLTSGVASIEAYINEWVRRYNHINPHHQLVDDRNSKVSIDEKFERWIPIITNGKRFDKSSASWAQYKKLREIRDKEAIHVKDDIFGVNYFDLSNYMNMYKNGIARMLFNLHVIFNQIVPHFIIRASYFPKIEVVVSSD